MLVKQLELPHEGSAHASTPSITGHEIKTYKMHTIRTLATDAEGITHDTSQHVTGCSIAKYDLILGMDWMTHNKVITDTANKCGSSTAPAPCPSISDPEANMLYGIVQVSDTTLLNNGEKPELLKIPLQYADYTDIFSKEKADTYLNTGLKTTLSTRRVNPPWGPPCTTFQLPN
jgi:hypothetical protein